MANVLLKLQASSKLEEDKDFGIKGFKVIGNFLKSRTNSAGRKFDLVFNQSRGFDNFLTNFNSLKDAKLLKGNGRAYYFDFDPNTKFTQKTVKELYNTNKKWAKLFDEEVENLYYELLNDTAADYDNEESSNDESEDDADIELVECVDEEQDIWLGNDGNYYTSEGEPVEFEEE